MKDKAFATPAISACDALMDADAHEAEVDVVDDIDVAGINDILSAIPAISACDALMDDDAHDADTVCVAFNATEAVKAKLAVVLAVGIIYDAETCVRLSPRPLNEPVTTAACVKSTIISGPALNDADTSTS